MTAFAKFQVNAIIPTHCRPLL